MKLCPWHIAFAHNSYFRPRICVIPTWLPDSVSFVDHRNRTGCVTFRYSWPAKSISLHHVDKLGNGSQAKFIHGSQHSFDCLAAISFLSTYKTSITQSKGHTDDFLCWMYIDSKTVVVIRTSSCNKQTADGILRKEEKYLPHLQWLLRLDAADPDVREECRRLYYDQEVKWQEELNSEVYTPGRREESSRKSSQISIQRHLWVSVLLLCTTVSVFNYANI
ncbi:hypothetical protein Btru_002113 [Bulinus truncatus]|nr:hypothetical protein Btru_002113 [Bulinus truncatus]